MIDDSGRRSVRPRRASSLLEIVIVVTIVGVCATVALPKVGATLRNSELRGVTNRLKQDIGLLRQYCRRQSLVLEVQVEHSTPEITLQPPLPHIMGNKIGVVSYDDVCPGVEFLESDFDGAEGLVIDENGTLKSRSGAELQVADIMVGLSGAKSTVRLIEPMVSGT